ncbi:MAG TPA: hypothetical protein VF178_16055, partial [Gemmatimonadaceae bacterium]
AAELVSRTVGLLLRSDIPPAPTTLLNKAAPVLAHALSGPTGVGYLIPAIAIPLLALAGASSGEGKGSFLRGAVLIAVLGVVMSMTELEQGASIEAALAVAVGIPVMLAAARAWGYTGVAAWVLAGLVRHALDAVDVAAHATTVVERLGGALSLVVTVVLLQLVLRWIRRQPQATAGGIPLEAVPPAVGS